MTADEWVARIERVRAEDGFDSTDRPWWNTLSGPVSRQKSLTALPATDARLCSRCARWRPLATAFARHPMGPSGHLTTCKACVNAVRRARRHRQALERAS